MEPVPEAVRRDPPAEIAESMRRDVRILGDTLGQVLRESGGEELLRDVELLRVAVIAAREGAGSVDDVTSLVASFDLDRAEEVARAFTVYFHLVNLAEERQRVRALRERARSGVPGSGTLGATVEELIASDGADALDALVRDLRVHPVLTAHPTEARRRAVVSAVVRAGEQLDRFDDPRASLPELADARRRLLEEVTILWRTSQLRTTRPGPLDEVRTAMAVFDETLIRVVPRLYRTLDEAIGGRDSGARAPVVPAFLRWGSWVGGDRDGNPHVTAAITRDTLAIQADHALAALSTIAARVGRTLTADERTTPPSEALRKALEADAVAYPTLMGDVATRSPAEPHRQKVLLAAVRLSAARDRSSDLAYRRPAELLHDLRLVQESLAAAGAQRLAYGELQHLVWQVETFGFHLAELEVRQHSSVHAATLAELLGPELAGDAAALDRLAGDAAAKPETSDVAKEALATFRVIADLQEWWGVAACRRYVVSFTRSALDLVAVRALARLAVGDRPLELDVVPLFETRDDLTRAVGVLDDYIALPGVAAWLAGRGQRLEVMLGYSDSAKDVGPASATLALYDTQGALTEWARSRGIVLTLFHGRGGALGRGGGPAHRAVRSQAPGSVGGRFKLTEQGEVVFARYGTRQIAERHLEQVTSAVLLASTESAEERTAAVAHRFESVAERLESAARTAYRALVETPGFAEYVGLVSPLEELGELAIGSRPARRGSARGLADLRAIPWVFAWAQTRCNLPGWYGLGSGLAAVAESDGGLDRLRDAYAEWPLFTSMLDNAEMSLAKTDRGIAERYLALGNQPELTAVILGELVRTTELVLAVTGHERLLDKHGVLARAVELRNPYVDALSHLQLRAMSALRAGEPDPAAARRLQRLLLLTVNGVAAGLQNTG